MARSSSATMTATSPTPARGLDIPNRPSQARGQLTKEETGEFVEHSSIGPSESSRPDSKDDPDMPLNWPRSRKVTIIALVAFSTFNEYVQFPSPDGHFSP